MRLSDCRVVLEKSELEDKFITDEIGQGHSAELMNTSEYLGTWGHAGSVLRFMPFKQQYSWKCGRSSETCLVLDNTDVTKSSSRNWQVRRNSVFVVKTGAGRIRHRMA